MCAVCYNDHGGNDSVCDLCKEIMTFNRTKKFSWHRIMFHHKIGRAKCKKYGYFAFYHFGSKSSVYIDIPNIINHYSLDFIPYLVHIISHEMFHLILREDYGNLYSTLLDGTYLRKLLKSYLGGEEVELGSHAKEIDKYNDELNRIVRDKHK